MRAYLIKTALASLSVLLFSSCATSGISPSIAAGTPNCPFSDIEEIRSNILLQTSDAASAAGSLAFSGIGSSSFKAYQAFSTTGLCAGSIVRYAFPSELLVLPEYHFSIPSLLYQKSHDLQAPPYLPPAGGYRINLAEAINPFGTTQHLPAIKGRAFKMADRLDACRRGDAIIWRYIGLWRDESGSSLAIFDRDPQGNLTHPTEILSSPRQIESVSNFKEIHGTGSIGLIHADDTRRYLSMWGLSTTFNFGKHCEGTRG